MFCSNCGKQIPENTRFCNYCGAQQNFSNTHSAAAQQQNANAQPPMSQGQEAAQQTKDNKPHKGMKIAGIILLCLQAVALLGSIANGGLAEMFTTGVMGIFEFAGFCLPGVIGVILLLKAEKKSEK